MKPVIAPTSDVNSETGVVVAWKADDRARVEAGAPLVEIETSKAVLEVDAPAGGFVLRLFREGDEAALSAPIALLFDDLEALVAYEAEAARAKAAAAAADDGVRASAKARARAAELGVDLGALTAVGLVTVKDVEAAAAARAPVDYSTMPSPLAVSPGVERVLLIGGGLGATQVIDIFRDHPGQVAVAILDDGRDKWGHEVYGVPVLGGTDRLEALYAEGAFDAVIVAISTSVKVRQKFRERCAASGVPLTNAIDRTAKLSSDVTIGRGNIICAFCHFGTGAVIGDNNFFSAYNSYDHHSVIKDDVSTGPGCMSSGRVTLGHRVRLGTGVFFEPGLELGDDVRVASGAIILRSIPANHAVKTKIVTTSVVPNR